ncbi:phosphoglucosamine mutase, partial [Striga asiatica]
MAPRGSEPTHHCLSQAVYRVGILAALRSIQTRSTIGLMITTSHNTVTDNGIKGADPSGGMLTQQWEPFADDVADSIFANATDPLALIQLLDDFVKKETIKLEGAPAAEVFLGRDTRPSGMFLVEAAKQGIKSIIGVPVSDIGVVTTPQLHWMVRAKNKGMEAHEKNYYDQLLTSFSITLLENISNNVNDKLIVDGADGVGGQNILQLMSKLSNLTIDVRNFGDGVINEGAGVDYVQKEKIVPRGIGPAYAGMRCASLDGDADRLIYFSVLPNSYKIDLVDGDKILSLFALFLKDQLSIFNGPEVGKNANNSYQTSLALVQTAYANGASTDYLKQLGLEVVLTPTGVKYLHEKAAEFDIGIYFEANGHGAILFSDNFLSWLETKNNELSSSSSEGSDQHKAALRLLAVSKLINQAVVDAILQHMGWSIHKWNGLYQDLPSRQLKLNIYEEGALYDPQEQKMWLGCMLKHLHKKQPI